MRNYGFIKYLPMTNGINWQHTTANYDDCNNISLCLTPEHFLWCFFFLKGGEFFFWNSKNGKSRLAFMTADNPAACHLKSRTTWMRGSKHSLDWIKTFQPVSDALLWEAEWLSHQAYLFLIKWIIFLLNSEHPGAERLDVLDGINFTPGLWRKSIQKSAP